MGEEAKKDEAGDAPAGEIVGSAVDESAKTRAGEPSRGMPDWLRFPLVLGIVGAISAAGLAGVYSLTRKRIEASKVHKIDCAFKSIVGARYAAYDERKVDSHGACYVIKDDAGEIAAYAAEVACPGSYNTGEPIQLIVVLEPELERLLGARVVKSAETPGLGERIREEPSSLSIVGWIAGREARRRLVLNKDGVLLGAVEEKKDGSVAIVGPDGNVRTLARAEYLRVTEAPFPPEFVDQFTNRPVAQAKLKADGGEIDGITGATISSRAVTKGIAKAAKLLRAAGVAR